MSSGGAKTAGGCDRVGPNLFSVLSTSLLSFVSHDLCVCVRERERVRVRESLCVRESVCERESVSERESKLVQPGTVCLRERVCV